MSRQGDLRLEKDVFGFQIAMYEPRLFQNSQSVKELGCEDLNKLRAEALELILLDQFVQVRRQ